MVEAERLNYERTQTAVSTTLKRIHAKQLELGISTFFQMRDYYNNQSNGLLLDKSVNYFLTIGKLEPIAHQIKLFCASHVSRTRTDCSGGNVRLVCDFGMLASNYEFFKKHGQPKNTQNRGATKQHFTTDSQSKRTKVDIPITPEWQKFRAGIKYANKISGDPITTPNAILIAIDEYMQKRPDIFGEDKRTLPDDSQIRTKTNSRIHADIDPELVAKVSQIIARHNAVNTSKIDWSGFVEMAVRGLVERLPVVYSDPELAAELEEQGADTQDNR